MATRFARVALVVGPALAGGCADPAAVDATTVLSFNRCHGIDAGLTRVDYAAVADIRGGTLLEMTGDDDTADGPDDEWLLVAISRGRQPTPGYGLTLKDAYRDGDTVVIRTTWETPESGAVLPQVLTHPCLVVGLPGDGFERVQAIDQTGAALGTLEL